MKRLVLSIAVVSFALLGIQAQQVEKLPVDEQVRVGHLDNGLTYYIRHNELPKQRAEFHIAQAVGAILEEDHQNGLAHFLEHMAFNGTEHFPGKGIINYFESVGVNFGGNINAYTSLDETVYRLSEVPTVREGIIDSALLVMHDWSCALSLLGEEIDAERGVIREEWRTGATAERRMWKELNPLMYPGSQYAKRDVIGDTAVINNFSYQALRDYYHKWYGPDLQAIVVVGDVDVDAIEAKIKALWADVPARANRGERPVYSVDDNKEPIVAIVQDAEAQFTRIRIDFKKNPLPAELEGTNVDYLQNIYNSLICTMLNNRFQELAQQADASFVGAASFYTELVKAKDAFISIYVAKNGQETKAYTDLLTQLEKMRRYGFTNAELERAKTEMITSYEKSYNERNSVRNISYTREYIRNFLDGECIPGIEWEYNFVKNVLPLVAIDQINRLAEAYITDENVIISFSAPEKEGVVIPSQTEVLELFEGMKTLEIEAPQEEVFDNTLVKKAPKAGKIAKTSYNEVLGTTEWTLRNGVRVIIKPTTFKQDEIRMSAWSEGGKSMIGNPEDLPSAELATDIISFSGVGEFTLTQLQKALTGKYCSVSPSINAYSETMDGSSNVRDFETLLQLTYLYFTAPRKDADAFAALMSLMQTQLENKETNHKAVFRDSVSLMSSDYSPRTILWNKATLSHVSQDKAYAVYCERFANPADFVFFFTGNINPEDAQTKQLICQWLGGMKTNKKALEQWQDTKVRAPKGVVKNYFDRNMQIHTASNRIQYTAPMEWTLANDLNMEMIGRILSTRYLESIREREGGSYGVGCFGTVDRKPIEQARLIMQFDTDPEKQARLMEIIHEEIATIIAEGPLASDLQKEKESMLKDFQEDLEKNDWWDNTVLYNYYVYGVNYLTDYEDAVRSITAETVQATLNRLVEAGNVFEVVMFPVN
ncbi:MAG: insulinase family protein [Paludibacter sp.]|nr:insulinase family protein [Bacteroidales bacterium]MCM1068753.1 insulinase family protein [Prevotella sp.]MCM1354465.1 insulinase family protein [Bacteroides sp.]MCM1443268.1 insulinase family protein [Muribaculum sp.]MCM1481047.1 insulinase family protein [Paludibacter sp.]